MMSLCHESSFVPQSGTPSPVLRRRDDEALKVSKHMYCASVNANDNAEGFSMCAQRVRPTNDLLIK